MKPFRFASLLFSLAITLSSCHCNKSCITPEADSSDFCLVTDSVPDVILEIRYFSTFNFIGSRIDGYEQPIAMLTKEAASALRKVNDAVQKDGYCLKVFDAYRPQCAVDMFMRWAKNLNDTTMKAYFYPELTKDRLIPEEYIMEKSGHTRGSTIDLTLFDKQTEREVDMGAPFDYFGELSHPDYPVGGKPGMTPITEEQYRMRQYLRKVMLDNGFKPLESEWWHFTLKDEPYPDTFFTFTLNEANLKK
ncbi:MAG: M15 family metallopeptidase [Bacteroidaceae bacterium]|nr:M15 family metallopeptidase [Bacteroidaceae bacterium]